MVKGPQNTENLRLLPFKVQENYDWEPQLTRCILYEPCSMVRSSAAVRSSMIDHFHLSRRSELFSS